MDLSTLSMDELKNLLALVPAEIKRREKKGKAEALKAIQACAAEHGYNLEELVGASPLTMKRSPVAVKYRHPENADLSWTGRGRQPKWIAEFVAAGRTLDQLSV